MLAAVAAGLPAVAAAAAESFDLRDVDGRSLLSPVHNQHLCAHSLPHRATVLYPHWLEAPGPAPAMLRPCCGSSG